MKTIFYSFILMFATAFCWAQRTVGYVSFFPPAHIVHDNVQLTQDADSFFYSSTNSSGTLYTAQQGGLILGAANDSVTHISTITVNTAGGSIAIKNFNVDNVIKVISTGTINNIIIGDSNVCNNPTECDTVFISANKIYFPNKFIVGNIDYKVRSSNTTTLKFSNNFIPPLLSNEKLKWVNLRIDRTDTCRRYLVKYIGDEPNWSELNLCNPQ